MDRTKIKGKAVCSLYEARPMQCRTWPFWPELLDSQISWKEAKSGKDGCPGLDNGKSFSVDEINQILNQTIESRKSII